VGDRASLKNCLKHFVPKSKVSLSYVKKYFARFYDIKLLTAVIHLHFTVIYHSVLQNNITTAITTKWALKYGIFLNTLGEKHRYCSIRCHGNLTISFALMFVERNRKFE